MRVLSDKHPDHAKKEAHRIEELIMQHVQNYHFLNRKNPAVNITPYFITSAKPRYYNLIIVP